MRPLVHFPSTRKIKIFWSRKADFITLDVHVGGQRVKSGRPSIEDIRRICNEGCLPREALLGCTVMCAVNPVLG